MVELGHCLCMGCSKLQLFHVKMFCFGDMWGIFNQATLSCMFFLMGVVTGVLINLITVAGGL